MPQIYTQTNDDHYQSSDGLSVYMDNSPLVLIWPMQNKNKEYTAALR